MDEWAFFTVGLWVTGKGEEQFLPAFLRSLEETGHCHFVVKQRIGQLSPRSKKHKQKMVGKGKRLSSKQEDFALKIRGFLERSPANLAIVVDDLEHDRKAMHEAVYEMYREPLDKILLPRGIQERASVHLFVPMIEAYFLADVEAVNETLGLAIKELNGDPEAIRGPKGKLKQYCRDVGQSYDERSDGERVAGRVNLEKILANPNYCLSLRCLVKWCSRRIGESDTDRCQLLEGKVCDVTRTQIGD